MAGSNLSKRLLEELNKRSNKKLSLNELKMMGQGINRENFADREKVRQLISRFSTSTGTKVSQEKVNQVMKFLEQNEDSLRNSQDVMALLKRVMNKR